MSFETLVTVVAEIVVIAGAFAAIWNSLANKIDAAVTATETKTDKLVTDLNDFKLEVAKEYASITHIKDVEERLVKAIENLSSALESMPDRVSKILSAANRVVSKR
jgi:ABC-type transporter Mla subunit MlaD